MLKAIKHYLLIATFLLLAPSATIFSQNFSMANMKINAGFALRNQSFSPSRANFIFYNPTDDSPFRLSWAADAPLLTGGVAFEVAGRVLQKTLDRNVAQSGFDKNTINDFDRAMMMPHSKAWSVTRDVGQWVSIFVPAVLFAAPLGDYVTFLAMYAESFLLADGVNALCKALVSRYRPYLFEDGAPNIGDIDSSRSFFSGHTTRAFNGAVFASYVFAKYYPDTVWTPIVIAGSLSAATLTGVASVVSGHHFVSDVLLGAAVGSLTGFLVPFLHTLGKNHKAKPQIGANSVSVRIEM